MCGQAIEHGIRIDENSGKTATELKIKEAKNSLKGEKSPKEKFQIAMDTANKVLANIPDSEREDILRSYGIDPATSAYNWSV